MHFFERHIRHGLIVPKDLLVQLITTVGIVSKSGTAKGYYSSIYKDALLDWILAGYELIEFYGLLNINNIAIISAWLDRLPELIKGPTSWADLDMHEVHWVPERNGHELAYCKLRCEMVVCKMKEVNIYETRRASSE